MFANPTLWVKRAPHAHASTLAHCHVSLRWTHLSGNIPADIQICTQALMRKTRRDSCSMLPCARIQLRCLREQRQMCKRDVARSPDLIFPSRPFMLRACFAACSSLSRVAHYHAQARRCVKFMLAPSSDYFHSCVAPRPCSHICASCLHALSTCTCLAAIPGGRRRKQTSCCGSSGAKMNHRRCRCA